MLSFPCVFEFPEEFGEESEFLEFDDGEFFDFLFGFAVVREVVPAIVDAFERDNFVSACSGEGDESCGVGLDGKEDEVVHELHATCEVGAVVDVGGWFPVDFGFG